VTSDLSGSASVVKIREEPSPWITVERASPPPIEMPPRSSTAPKLTECGVALAGITVESPEDALSSA
jgi:hypothetical protein